ncbi:hypothetical protein SLEP1_g18432 [Rubroshorea leprosula]|uniref:BED-type domain-containing protein n=1 Tax=Rubroshorea leprosula TaxID=152421 RepID=A0AAV5J6J3_9ROSI|nr:hypothetical protein SLEP1_g18432 [Rubroshorea leprosula]
MAKLLTRELGCEFETNSTIEWSYGFVYVKVKGFPTSATFLSESRTSPLILCHTHTLHSHSCSNSALISRFSTAHCESDQSVWCFPSLLQQLSSQLSPTLLLTVPTLLSQSTHLHRITAIPFNSRHLTDRRTHLRCHRPITTALTLAALQLTAHLQLSSKAAAGSAQPASHRGTLPSARHCKSAPLTSTSSSSKARSSSFSFGCRVASSSAALPQILFKLSSNSSASIIPSAAATPTSSSTMVPLPLTLESGTGEDKKDDQGHKRPLTSEAWNHYRRQKINGHWKAICVYCNKHLGGETKNGTSHLRDHTRVCPLKSVSDIRQTFLRASKNQEGKTELGHGLFNQEMARRELAYMITAHELPLSIVDHIFFRRFVAALQPRFKYVSRNTIKKDIMGIYRNEKAKTMKLLEVNQSRIAITTDMWTSNNQKRGFMVITAHYIDNSWMLQNRIISFQYVPCPHTSEEKYLMIRYG